MADQIINAFNNSWSFVQIAMLLVPLAGLAVPVGAACWLVRAYICARHTLPNDVILAVRTTDMATTITVHHDAPLTPKQIMLLLPDPRENADNPISGTAPDPPLRFPTLQASASLALHN